ncbi:hypothetical protein CANCADRAFT_29957, partial [Tortispora caseinolytica NRRL Y-17796]
MTPLDVVRVRMQIQDHKKPVFTNQALKSVLNSDVSNAVKANIGITACCRDVLPAMETAMPYCVASELDSCAVENVKQRRFVGTWEGLSKIARYEGLSSLWRGLSVTVLMAVPSNMMYFAGYEFLRDSQIFSSRYTEYTSPLICGAIARLFASSLTSPMELFRTRLQSLASVNNGSERPKVTAFRSTYIEISSLIKREGLHTLWRGLGLTLWRDVPFSAIYWLGFETIKASYLDKRPDSDSFTPAFIAGALSGSIAAFITTPFDVGKTRMQVYIDGNKAATSSSMISTMMDIGRSEGLAGLFKGLSPRVLKISPACAIMISSYDVTKSLFN